jgi:hypothetical protein
MKTGKTLIFPAVVNALFIVQPRVINFCIIKRLYIIIFIYLKPYLTQLFWIVIPIPTSMLMSTKGLGSGISIEKSSQVLSNWQLIGTCKVAHPLGFKAQYNSLIAL